MKQLLFFLLLFSRFYLPAQQDAWVFFKDKPQAKTFLENPTSMLSQHALERRRNQSIAITLSDVPLDNTYYQYLKSEKGIVLLAKSKWLNAVHVRGTEDAIAGLQTNFSFINRIEFADKTLNKKPFSGQVKPTSTNQNKFGNMTLGFDYGNATEQITMIKANVLHAQDLTGSGIRIAIMDAGFPNVNTLNAFERLRRQEKLLGGYNFVERKEDFYTGHQHGTNVLSDIAGYVEGEFIGTAPDASFYLFITEDVANETPLEESLWVEAAEKADSLV
ncbi:hypothetical protein [Tenacibaculum sp. SG-28]|uniref:hypothetical protein n=1 Tax=Tenacibaculum sp. SG-28 TaxID=754426 RepID=UPI001E61E2ED|nr:hypothetical protein [Tenacibaculum sp. SG-28]